MNNHRKFLLLLICICICFMLFFIVQIYAKYITTTEGSTSLTIANWNILVNNSSIKNNTDISNSIVPVFPGNEHISSNIIAPSATGYFDLYLDFSNVDVSFKYEITASAHKDSSIQDLVSTGYSVDDGEIINFETYNTTLTDNIYLSNELRTRKIRIYILWNDDEATQTMSNSDDTLTTINNTPALLHVNISFTQITDVTIQEETS